MSNITDTKANLKKILTSIEEINQLTVETIPKLKEHPQNLLQQIETLEQAKNSKINEKDSNSSEITNLKEQITSDDHEISKLEENIEELNAKKQNLTNEIQEAQAELQELQEKIATKKAEYENRSQRLEELESNIKQLSLEQQKFEERMKELEQELQEEFDKKDQFAKSFGNRVKAMKMLIEKDYIHSPQLQLINALQINSAIDLKNVVIALDVKENQAKEIIRKMVEQGGPVEYDEVAGTVTLKEEVDFK